MLDYKKILQEYAQEYNYAMPIYEEKQSDNDGVEQWETKLIVFGRPYNAFGSSQMQAQVNAAKEACRELNIVGFCGKLYGDLYKPNSIDLSDTILLVDGESVEIEEKELCLYNFKQVEFYVAACSANNNILYLVGETPGSRLNTCEVVDYALAFSLGTLCGSAAHTTTNFMVLTQSPLGQILERVTPRCQHIYNLRELAP